MRRYEAAGVDQVIFVLQAGPNKHEHICESLELFAEQVMPGVRRRARAARGDEGRAAGAGHRARPGPSQARPRGAAGLHDRRGRRARAGRSLRAGPAAYASAPRSSARRRAARSSDGVQGAIARFVRGASDDQLERRFGNRVRPARDLQRHGAPVRAQVRLRLRGRHRLRAEHVGNGQPHPRAGPCGSQDGSASAIPGGSQPPAVTFRLSIADFARLVAEEVDPQELLFGGRFEVEGDLQVATRVREMFGGAPQF